MADTVKPSEVKKENKSTKPSDEDVKKMETTKVETLSDEKAAPTKTARRGRKPSNSELSYSIGVYEGSKKLFWDFDHEGNVAYSNTSKKPPFTPPEFNEDSDKEG